MMGKGMLRCLVNADEYVIRADEVRHVARADQMRADNATDGRLGALTLGGHNVPVFAMSDALGLARPDPLRRHGDQHIAVTGEPHDLVGWMVDRVGRTVADGRVAALPPSIGGRARRWFDGVVTFADSESPLLLIAPHHLNPLNTSVDHTDTASVFEEAVVIESPPAQPVALIFSTTVLPSSMARRFALSGRQVAAITQPTAPVAVPGSARHIAGLTMWRNTAVPILDFREEPDRASGGEQRQLIARCKSHGRSSLVAFAIESEIAMHRPDAQDRLLSELPPPPFTNGLFEIDGEPVALLDLDALLQL